MRHGWRSLPGSILMPVTARRGRCCVGRGVGSPQEGTAVGAELTQPRKRKRQRRWGVPVRATHEDHVWTYDFLHDRTEGARQCGC